MKKASQKQRRRLNALVQLAGITERTNSSYEFAITYEIFERYAYVYVKGERSECTVTVDYALSNRKIIAAILKGIDQTRQPDPFAQIVFNALGEANRRYPHLRSYFYDQAGKLLSA